MCSHVVASTAEMSLPTTIFIFHVSGIVACQTLMWVLVSEILWWYIINVLVLLVASFCFNYKDITELIRVSQTNPMGVKILRPDSALGAASSGGSVEWSWVLWQLFTCHFFMYQISKFKH
ncbi:hypothetical protein JHK87_049239 [Glycine soja]|nr:hypothetical protein JHK87_049239 [Glycine soja]